MVKFYDTYSSSQFTKLLAQNPLPKQEEFVSIELTQIVPFETAQIYSRQFKQKPKSYTQVPPNVQVALGHLATGFIIAFKPMIRNKRLLIDKIKKFSTVWRIS